MPRLTDATLESHKLPKGSYGYSAAKIGDLGATEFTLVTIINDVSSSVASFKSDMEDTLQKIVESCESSPRRDNLLIRLVQFANSIGETHGFQALDACKQYKYADCLNVGGSTALFDASQNGVMATHDYAKKLADQRFMVNAIVIVITDGCDNASASSANDVKKALALCMKDEALESVVSILIGVGISDTYVASRLADFQKEAGFTQYIEQSSADAKTLAKLAEFVSKSISAQSQSLGSGGPSKPITF